jgi:transcriptional regulator of acetoin/glycerol metabolism
MGAVMETSGAMHLIKEIPADDGKKLHCMARVFLKSDMDMFDLIEFAENAYKIGRETEARRHQCYVLGSLEDAEYISILRALEATGFSPSKAAHILKIGKSTMYRKLEYFKIDYGQKKDETEEVAV